MDNLEKMRRRILSMRSALVERLAGGNDSRDVSFVNAQRGLFSYFWVERVGDRQTEDGARYSTRLEMARLCLAALNPTNLDPVAAAIRQVSRRN